MILPIHIVIALTSLILTSLSIFSPTAAKLRASYAFIISTLVSGTYLVILHPAHLKQSCISGLTYLAVALVGVVIAQKRLRLVKVTTKVD